MKITQSTLVRVSVRNGLIAGGLSAVLLIVMFYMGQHPVMIAPYFDYRIFLFGVFIFFAAKEIRDNTPDGALYFVQAMASSYLVIFVATIIGSLGLFLFSSLEPRFVSSYIDGMTQYLKSFPEEDIKRIGKEVYDSNLQALPTTNSVKLMITYFGQGIMIGLFVGIILSAILRKQPKTP